MHIFPFTLRNDLRSLLPCAGLCPLLPAARDLHTAVVSSLLIMAGLAVSACTVSACRRFIHADFALPLLILVTTSTTTVLWWYLQAYHYEVALAMGISLPVLAMNSVWLARLDVVALRNPCIPAAGEALMTGCLATGLLSAVGFLREFLASGGIRSLAALPLAASEIDGAVTVPVPGWQGPDLIGSTAGALLIFGCILAVCRQVGIVLGKFFPGLKGVAAVQEYEKQGHPGAEVERS